MSISLLVACRKCKVYLNIGQSSISLSGKTFSRETFIFTEEKDTMKQLNEFIDNHVIRCHEVIFCSDGDGDLMAKELRRYINEF